MIPHSPVNDFLVHEGSRHANVVGSAEAPVHFKYTADRNNVRIRSIIFVIEAPTIRSDYFGDIDGGLVNGLHFTLWDADGYEKHCFCGNTPLKTLSDFGLVAGADLAYETDLNPTVPDVFVAHFRPPFSIAMDEGDNIRMTVLDDLSSLTRFHAIVQGVHR